MSADDEWKGILREGERILWQGQPDGGFFIHRSRFFALFVSILFILISVVFLIAAFGLEEPRKLGFMFIVIFAGFSLYQLLRIALWPTYKRRHTFYTLTNRRAILGIAIPGCWRTLKYFEITAHEEYKYNPGKFGSIVFAYEGDAEAEDEPGAYAAGFMRFAEADKVWPMIQQLQQEMRDARAQTSDNTGAAHV